MWWMYKLLLVAGRGIIVINFWPSSSTLNLPTTHTHTPHTTLANWQAGCHIRRLPLCSSIPLRSAPFHSVPFRRLPSSWSTRLMDRSNFSYFTYYHFLSFLFSPSLVYCCFTFYVYEPWAWWLPPQSVCIRRTDRGEVVIVKHHHRLSSCFLYFGPPVCFCILCAHLSPTRARWRKAI